MEDVGDVKDVKEIEEVANDEDNERLRDDLHTSADELTRQILDIIPEALIKTEANREADKTSEEMCSKIDSLVPPLLQWKKEKNEKIACLGRDCSELYAKWQSTELQRANHEAEIERLKNQLSMQADYCTKLGTILGHLVWRASNQPEMINFWISDRSTHQILGEFLCIANITVEVFFATYVDVTAAKSRGEYKFAKRLLGTLTNISASAEGRQFLIENAAGKGLVNNLVKYLPQLPTMSGRPLIKLILLTLWNICVNKNGLRYLFELQVGRAVARFLDKSITPEIQHLALDVLQSMTYNLEPDLLGQLIDDLLIEKIRLLARGGPDKSSNLAREILNYLENPGVGHRANDTSTSLRTGESSVPRGYHA